MCSSYRREPTTYRSRDSTRYIVGDKNTGTRPTSMLILASSSGLVADGETETENTNKNLARMHFLKRSLLIHSKFQTYFHG